jgi:hypothetical protein
LSALLVTGCLGKTELLTLPPPPPASLNLRFQAEDAATAQSLGWQPGIPDVEVTLMPEDTTQATLHLRSAPDGTLNADDIPGGRYELRAVRWLTDTERGRLAQGDDAVGFLTKSTLVTGSATGPIFLTTSRRRGLVISEWMSAPLYNSSVSDDYLFSGYLRLYNNADTTAFLDGLIIGSGLAGQFDYPNFGCNLYRPYSEDPAGIWALRFVQLPGTGTQYPLPPGQTAVLVTDAIDHRPLFPGGLDLRRANFEYYGDADVDNPDVPNAPEAGQPTPLGHGLFWSSLANIVFVALPLDPGTLRRQALPGNQDFLWARIPKEKLIEVMAMKTTYRPGYPECERLVHETFDREAVKLLEFGGGTADSLAYRRLVVPFTISGRAVLQHTRWSALDFRATPRTPFAQP